MKRRELLAGSVAAGLSLGAGFGGVPRVFAQASPLGLRDRKLMEIARQQQAKAGSMLWRTDFVGIADYGLRSSEPRFHFVNLEAGRVDSYLVSHGDGSDPEHDGWLNWFSNEDGSHCSSKGTYMTYGWYTGRYGTSIRLEGIEPTNSNALNRAIVMHRASYAEPEFLDKWGRLGRSNGCFAMGDAQFKLALLHLGGGRVLYADSLGLREDGSIIPEDQRREIEVLTPERPTGIQQLNPGVY
ncbi:murein L,D-transpeptidase catalytic domain-containing protein [Allopontixanthobacter sp.]|uniref:murein L,D-transpeptidase catalytic domain-containing protein n=1 Tax=Allopontixanthobacter sp. TaxID=2906452 RepID=UPI002ABBD48D|nr:murein L,D-transpeptidase catalytic domain family protein [Allopontixanthobacter sp.]MDZ4307676.1 murein L,D-transpeptidase catalytic domain family protein [Allopontixanthobacter sp.]